MDGRESFPLAIRLAFSQGLNLVIEQTHSKQGGRLLSLSFFPGESFSNRQNRPPALASTNSLIFVVEPE